MVSTGRKPQCLTIPSWEKWSVTWNCRSPSSWTSRTRREACSPSSETTSLNSTIKWGLACLKGICTTRSSCLNRNTSGQPLAISSLKTISSSKKKVFYTLIHCIEETIEETSRVKLNKLESQLNEMKREHYSLINENKEQSEKLNKELQNSVKSSYLKNVLVGYLTTNDQSVNKIFVNLWIGEGQFAEGYV